MFYLDFCFLSSFSSTVQVCDLACTWLQTSLVSSPPKINCHMKCCNPKRSGLREGNHLNGMRHKNKSVYCSSSVFSITTFSTCKSWTYPGALAIGVNGDGGFVNSFHKPIRQFIFQGGVEINLGSKIPDFKLARRLWIAICSQQALLNIKVVCSSCTLQTEQAQSKQDKICDVFYVCSIQYVLKKIL